MSAKTIKMPAELLAKWLAALRASELHGKKIKQAPDVLSDGKRGFCCLGVLQMCASGRTQKDKDGDDMPSLEYLRRHDIRFSDTYEDEAQIPYLPKLDMSAAQANDSGHSFAQIADAIEACAEGV